MVARFLLALVLGVLSMPVRAETSEKGRSLATGTGTLWGTLSKPSSPSSKRPILLLAGSGPTDRDGNGPSIHPDTLRLIAQGLAAHGVTSLRIDKRGIGQSASAMHAESDLRFQTYSDDARAWAAELKKETGASCVWLLGHSEGALVAEVAAENNPDICGLVLIAGAGRNAGELIRSQLTASLPESLKADAFATLNSLEAGITVPSPPPQLMALFRPSVQPYLISWLSLDPASLLARTTAPALIMQGTNDLQVSVDDAQRLAKARPDAKLVLLEGVNHVLKLAPPDRAANFATYRDPTLPLAPGITDTIADFLEQHNPT